MYTRETTLARTGTLAKELGLITTFATLTALGAQVAVRLPFSPVPVTLQVLMVIVTGLALGSRRGFASLVGYLAVGAAGLPIFAGGAGGAPVLFGPTGGYLFAFPFAAFAAGWLSERLRTRSMAAMFGAALAAVAVIYCGGSLWLSIWLGATGSHSIGAALAGAWQLGVKPFIVLDVAKAVAAVGAVQGTRAVLPRWFGQQL